ncbi:MAG TPA: YciI family protein [Planktothrix sp.]
MQFLVIGYDGTDKEALERRMKARDAHLALGDKMRDEGNLLYAVAILDDDGKMVGSNVICEFESRTQLEDWLKEEPYMTGDVWQQVEIHNCKVGPSFASRKTAG